MRTKLKAYVVLRSKYLGSRLTKKGQEVVSINVRVTVTPGGEKANAGDVLDLSLGGHTSVDLWKYTELFPFMYF